MTLTLQQLASKYGPDEAEAAYNDAVARQEVTNPLAYAERTLQNGGVKERGGIREREPVTDNHECCDGCGRSFFVNDFGLPVDGRALCNECRKARQQSERVGPLTLRPQPPNEAQREWDRAHAEIEARYQQRLESLQTPEVWAKYRARLRELHLEARTKTGGKTDTVQAKIDDKRMYHTAKLDACPEWAQLDQLYWMELRKLGLRPLLHWDELEFVTEDGAKVEWTRAGKRLAAYWASMERSA